MPVFRGVQIYLVGVLALDGQEYIYYLSSLHCFICKMGRIMLAS